MWLKGWTLISRQKSAKIQRKRFRMNTNHRSPFDGAFFHLLGAAGPVNLQENGAPFRSWYNYAVFSSNANAMLAFQEASPTSKGYYCYWRYWGSLELKSADLKLAKVKNKHPALDNCSRTLDGLIRQNYAPNHPSLHGALCIMNKQTSLICYKRKSINNTHRNA